MSSPEKDIRRPAAAACDMRLSSTSLAAPKLLLISKNVGRPPVKILLRRCCVVVGGSATKRYNSVVSGYFCTVSAIELKGEFPDHTFSLLLKEAAAKSKRAPSMIIKTTLSILVSVQHSASPGDRLDGVRA